MYPKPRWHILVVVLALVLLAGASLTHSYGLAQRDREMIAIAYLNGAADALSFDLERIKALKADGPLLRQTVQDATRIYLIKVERITAANRQSEAEGQRALAGNGISPKRQW